MKEFKVSGSDAVMQKMEKALLALQHELDEEAQALKKRRDIEDTVASMAKDVEMSKV